MAQNPGKQPTSAAAAPAAPALGDNTPESDHDDQIPEKYRLALEKQAEEAKKMAAEIAALKEAAAQAAASAGPAAHAAPATTAAAAVPAAAPAPTTIPLPATPTPAAPTPKLPNPLQELPTQILKGAVGKQPRSVDQRATQLKAIDSILKTLQGAIDDGLGPAYHAMTTIEANMVVNTTLAAFKDYYGRGCDLIAQALTAIDQIPETPALADLARLLQTAVHDLRPAHDPVDDDPHALLAASLALIASLRADTDPALLAQALRNLPTTLINMSNRGDTFRQLLTTAADQPLVLAPTTTCQDILAALVKGSLFDGPLGTELKARIRRDPAPTQGAKTLTDLATAFAAHLDAAARAGGGATRHQQQSSRAPAASLAAVMQAQADRSARRDAPSQLQRGGNSTELAHPRAHTQSATAARARRPSSPT